MPPNITIGRLQIGTDKPGKDTNFRAMTIFNNTLHITKGSGGNGINSVYQVGSTGTLPTGAATELATVPVSFLPGFPSTTRVLPPRFRLGSGLPTRSISRSGAGARRSRRRSVVAAD
ncbi:MAG: hypothetical protein WAK48_28925 [Candidatus Acidiferrum sp.]